MQLEVASPGGGVCVIHLTKIVLLSISWGLTHVIIVDPCGLKDFISVRILWKDLISPLSFECLVASLGGLSATVSGDLVGFLVSKSSTSFVYVELVGGSDGCLQGLRNDIDFAGGILEFRDIFSVMFKMYQL